MSYCRVGKDCDIYCYEQEDGKYWVSVAAKRLVGDIPKVDWTNSTTLYESQKAQVEFVNTAMTVPLGLPYDGKSMLFDTLMELFKGLVELANVGYNVPQHVLDTIMNDLEEMSVE